MTKLIRCKDEELLQAAAAHAREAHGLDSIPVELMPMVEAAIRDE